LSTPKGRNGEIIPVPDPDPSLLGTGSRSNGILMINGILSPVPIATRMITLLGEAVMDIGKNIIQIIISKTIH
jgi:hypothetical protein